MDRLSIYLLDRPHTDAGGLVAAAEQVFKIRDNFAIFESPGRLSLRSGERLVEQQLASGGIWAANQEAWFNPSARPKLPDRDRAVSIAQDLGSERGLLPDLEGEFGYGEPRIAGTYLAMSDDGKRSERQLDVQIVFPITVAGLPVVGGGGDFTFALGDSGELIGYTGVWREVAGAFDASVVPQERADDAYRELFAASDGLELESVTSYLAYYSAPTFVSQEFLYPVYVYVGTARIGENRVPLRAITLPATDFGPKLELPPPAPRRPTRAQPTVRPETEKPKRRAYAALGPGRRALAAPTKPWEAGTSWIGMSGGLPGSQANAQGFVDEWAADGWIIDFNWGDAAAWETDWRRNDDLWVDNADFVFYTGHASGDGWVLSKPDDKSLDFTEVGASPQAPGDLWGSGDLEWVIIAACGPLQDDLVVTGGGDVLDRWDGAFDGMHQLLGYASTTLDNTEEGRRVASYCRSGMTVKDAWFRAAKEIQPSTINDDTAPETVWVGTMWAAANGIDPIDDHAWSHGSVSADPTSPTSMACMWTVC
jgi:hypothetical protein